MGKNQHVVPRDGRWAVRVEGNSRIASEHRTQGAAINSATKMARSGRSEVVIHGRDGKIRDKESYHVVARYDGKWSVRKTGDARASRVFDNEKKATSFGRYKAKGRRGEIIIHGSDGRVRSADSYGCDSYPLRKGR